MDMNKLIRIVVILTCVTGVWSLGFLEFSTKIINYDETNSILEYITSIEKTVSHEMLLTTFLDSTTFTVYNYLPRNCSQREKLKHQPTKDKNSRLKKCCPIGESLSKFTNDKNTQLCDSTNINFTPNIINAVLYDNCIEDDESEVSLPLEIGNPCNTSIVYNNREDIFYVLQDGSLLIMDEFANDTYTVQHKYCMDVDISDTIYAFICITSVEEHLQRGQVVTVAILTLVSIPCLCFVSYLHLAIKELRTLHGVSLSLMSFCLMLGYFLHSLVHIFKLDASFIGYAVQFFILSYYFWFCCLCGNVLLNIWLKLPLNGRNTKYCSYGSFIVYSSISFLGPLLLVILTIHKGLPGMPSYFLQGITESIRGSQRYFIPPVSTILFISFVVMILSFFGFQKFKGNSKITNRTKSDTYLSVNTAINEEKYEEVKKDAKCISLLGIILIISWLLEIVTFYSPGPQNYLILMEIINGLQGVFIMMIFLVVRRRRTLIIRWWCDRGSHNLEKMELSPINQ